MEKPILGATLFGSHAHLIRVETRTGRGLSRVILVGMPDAVAREARERLPSALQKHQFPFPKGKVLFNLVPAQLPKCGLPFDLALAISLLVEEKLCPPPPSLTLFLAELDLQGRLGPPARGTLLAALAAVQGSCTQLITAPAAAQEASLAPGIQAYGLVDLGEVVQFLRKPQNYAPQTPLSPSHLQSSALRLDDLRGQKHARKAAILAIAGRHSLWMQGPPGTGKSMLARRLSHLLPDLSAQQALEVAQIEALLGPLSALSLRPPFRAPHTSASAQALLGGGNPLRPGEIARAHAGILFLDEMPEFTRPVLEGLRQPLEEKEVRLQRARAWATYPADVQLIATSNPCPCGFATHPKIPCTCTPAKLQTYYQRISGPLRDRFDLFVEMSPSTAEELEGPPSPPHDEEVVQRLQKTRQFQNQQKLQRGFGQSTSASLEQIQHCGLESQAAGVLRQAVAKLPLSGRGVLRCLRVARTAADYDLSVQIRAQDMHLALSFRPLPVAKSTTAPSHFPLRVFPRRTEQKAAHSPGGSPN